MPPRLKRGHDVSCRYKTENESKEWRREVAATKPRRRRIRWTFGGFAFITCKTGPS